MTHTKGWEIGKPKKFHDQHYTPIMQPLIGERVFLMTDVCWVLDADEVNLIATAPKLLEALKVALGPVEFMASAIDADPEDHERLALVQAAIAKATEPMRPIAIEEELDRR